jgi:hypothetical protein
MLAAALFAAAVTPLGLALKGGIRDRRVQKQKFIEDAAGLYLQNIAYKIQINQSIVNGPNPELTRLENLYDEARILTRTHTFTLDGARAVYIENAELRIQLLKLELDKPNTDKKLIEDFIASAKKDVTTFKRKFKLWFP